MFEHNNPIQKCQDLHAIKGLADNSGVDCWLLLFDTVSPSVLCPLHLPTQASHWLAVVRYLLLMIFCINKDKIR